MKNNQILLNLKKVKKDLKLKLKKQNKLKYNNLLLKCLKIKRRKEEIILKFKLKPKYKKQHQL